MAITASMVKELREMTGAGMMDCKNALKETDGNMEKAVDVLREKGLSSAAKKSGRVAAEGLVVIKQTSDNKEAVMVEVNSETDFVTKNEEFKAFVDEVADIALSEKVASLDELLNSKSSAGTVQDLLTSKIAKIGENMNIRRVARLTVKNGVIASYIHAGGNIGSLIKVESDSDDTAALLELGKDIAMQTAAMSPKYLDEKSVDEDYIKHEKEVLKTQALNENAALPEGRRKPEQIVLKMIEGRFRKELKEVCLVDQAFVKEPKKSVKDIVSECAKKLGKDIKIAEFVRYQVGEGLAKKEEDFAEEVAKQMGN